MAQLAPKSATGFNSLKNYLVFSVVHLQTALPPPETPGIWRKKLIWKARWVKEWRSEKKWHPVWRKVWSPVEIREWLPLPRPPPPELQKPEHHEFPSHPPPDHAPPNHLPENPPSSPPPFRPINSYGAPVNTNPSTPLHPVPESPPPQWPAPDMEELLQNYHTIRDAEPVFEPRSPNKIASEYRKPENASEPVRDGSTKNSVSPYAAKLAQAVLREKFNQSLNPTERPSGLTDVIFNPSSTTPQPKEKINPFGKSTESPSNVFIVTPVSFG